MNDWFPWFLKQYLTVVHLNILLWFDVMTKNDIYFSFYCKAKCTLMNLSHDFIALCEICPIYYKINKFSM